MKYLTYDEVKENLKSLGDSEREIVETADQISEVINAIVKARDAQGLTQKQLAEKCGMKQSAIARMESMQSIPRLDTIIRVANCLKLKLSVESKYVQQIRSMSKYDNNKKQIWVSHPRYS